MKQENEEFKYEIEESYRINNPELYSESFEFLEILKLQKNYRIQVEEVK